MFLSRLLQKLISSGPSKTDEELHTAKIRLELALESSGLVDWDFDFEKNTAHRGLQHDQLYGYKEMLPAWNFDNFYHHVLPEFHDLAREKFANLPIEGNISFDYKIRRVDGEIRWISLKGRGHKDKNGKVTRVAGVLKDVTVEKNFEERMNLFDMNINSLFEKAPEFFCILNSHLVYEYVNPAHKLLFNGRNMTSLSVEEAQPELKDSPFVRDLKKILKTGETIIFTDSAAQIGERLRYLDMVYSPRINAKNEIDGIYVLGSDVTDKIEAIKNAESSEAKIRLITDKLPAFISYTDTEGRYQFMNEMYEKWFKRPISEMLGKTRNEIAPPEYAIQSKPYETQAIKGIHSHHEGIIRKASGEYMNLDINFISDVDPITKKVRGMIAVGADITAQKKALREAELAQKELHEVFMQAPSPMCLLTGPDHVFTMANPLYVSFVKRDVLGKTLLEAFEGEDITYFQEIIRQVYSTGEPYLVNQAPIELYDNGKLSRRYINVGYHAFKDSHDKVKGVLVILQDVTEQVNSVIARDNFISIASHELKTPITALKLHMQMNQKMLEHGGVEAFSAERMSKIFSGTVSQVNRLSRLVDDMLDGSRISAESLRMTYSKVNFSKLVKDTFEDYLLQFAGVEMDLKLNIEEDIVMNLDESRIEQVLINLITNAIRYAPKSPLHVDLKKGETQVVLTVKDQGIGIDPAYHQKIFERFERVDAGRDVSGLGLGLYIAKKIIQNHGGEIKVSGQLGMGSEFKISIPLD